MKHCVSLQLLGYFGVDIKAIQEYAKAHDVQHLRAEIR